MKRRDLLIAGGSLVGGLPLLARAVPCPPPSVSLDGGPGVSSTCSTGTALADWNARSQAAGVVQAIRFPSAANVTNYTHANSLASRVTWDPTGGVIGDGGVRINIPAADADGGAAWRAPLNASWTTDGQGFGIGVPFYVQYRARLGPNWTTRISPGDGAKLMNIANYQVLQPNNSHSNVAGEIVLQNEYQWGIPILYRDTGGHTVDFTANMGGQPSYHNAIDNGAAFSGGDRYCWWNGSGGATPACWTFPLQQWFTIYFRIEVANYTGGSGNHITMQVARQGATSYTSLIDVTGASASFSNGGPDALCPNGHNGIWWTTYHTNRTSAPFASYTDYDQLIVSTSPIACPQV